MYAIRLQDQDVQYINELYKSSHGYVKIWNGKNRGGAFIPANYMCRNDVEDTIIRNGIYNSNAYMSVSVFKNRKNARKNNIAAVMCIPIDIDFTFTDNKGNLVDPLTVWDKLTQDLLDSQVLLPMPTYIEYGHRLRLVYMLNDGGVCIPKDKKGRESTLTILRRIQEEILKCINGLDVQYHAEYNEYTKFVRIPESIVRKYKTVYDNGHNYLKSECVSKNVVKVKEIKNGKRWDFRELADIVLPKLPEWYQSYLQRKNKKKEINKRTYNNLNGTLRARLLLLERLQQEGYNVGHREMMCHLYWNFTLQLTGNSDETWDKVKQFNSQFVTPLRAKDLRSHVYSKRTYKYKDETFLKKLGLDIDNAGAYNYNTADRKKNRSEYMAQYRKEHKPPISDKQQQITQFAKKAKEMRSANYTIAQIAMELKLSESTVKRYLKIA